MALAKAVKKMFPTESLVGIHLEITDDERPDLGAGAQIVISTVISEQHVAGEDVTNETRDKIGARAQVLIDKYKALRARYDNEIYTTKVAQIDGALTL